MWSYSSSASCFGFPYRHSRRDVFSHHVISASEIPSFCGPKHDVMAREGAGPATWLNPYLTASEGGETGRRTGRWWRSKVLHQSSADVRVVPRPTSAAAALLLLCYGNRLDVQFDATFVFGKRIVFRPLQARCLRSHSGKYPIFIVVESYSTYNTRNNN